MRSFVLSKLGKRRIWQRLFRERLAEPLHLNLFSLLIAAFGSFRAKVDHDLVLRQHNAYCLLKCADYAKRQGSKTVSVLEFGVAAGAGLMNMVHIARRVTNSTGIGFKLYGFDTGAGMPEPLDYRDHPDLYRPGDFPMDVARLRAALPANAQLVIGEVSRTVPEFLKTLSSAEPIAYVVFDVDYYSSTRDALRILQDADPAKYLPITLTYFDDIALDAHNSYCGQLLAVDEFNRASPLRKLEHPRFLEVGRIYKKARWLKHIFLAHVLDHATRTTVSRGAAKQVLTNPYL